MTDGFSLALLCTVILAIVLWYKVNMEKATALSKIALAKQLEAIKK